MSRTKSSREQLDALVSLLEDISKHRGLLSELSAAQCLDLLGQEGVVEGGMIPKLESSVDAIKAGVGRVHLVDGRVEHALVQYEHWERTWGEDGARATRPAPRPSGRTASGCSPRACRRA